MPSYPAKPYVVPYDDWFNNKSNYENNPTTKETKKYLLFMNFFTNNRM